MKLVPSLVLPLLLGSAAAADEATTPGAPLKLPAHAQPSQREIEALPPKDRAHLGVDLSPHDQQEVDELYRQLTHEKPAGSTPPR